MNINVSDLHGGSCSVAASWIAGYHPPVLYNVLFFKGGGVAGL